MIKAIETRYNGYRFRSRLEARWAVFFDAIGINWSYETEGYNLGEVFYLPDFCIYDKPGLNGYNDIVQSKSFVEIKPGQAVSKEEWNKCVLLACESGIGVHLIIGDPGDEDVYDIEPSTLSEFPDFLKNVHFIYRPYEVAPSLWTQCTYCQHIDLHVDYILDAIEGEPYGLCWLCREGTRDSASPLIESAYNAARSARFEHGETPRVMRGKPRKAP